MHCIINRTGARRVGDGTLRAFVAATFMAVSLPAIAELRTVQSALPKPFPSIGDAVVGCRDPANTLHWIEIITGKLWMRNVQDHQGQTLSPSLRDVATGVRGFFHAYIRTGELRDTKTEMRSPSRLKATGMVSIWRA